jgi:hypothetical protein
MATEIAQQEPTPPEGRSARREKHALLRLGAWGSGAAISLAVLAITSQTEGGRGRLQLVIARAIQPELVITKTDVPARATGINPDSLRVEAQLRVLTADRDRLAARLAGLERNLDDMTGSIKKQAALAADTPKTPALPTIAPLAMPVSTEPAADWPGGVQAQTAAAARAQDPVPLPPTRIAAALASEPAAEPPHKPELGIDLGGASTLDVLNARWVAVKANFGPLLTGLHPLAAHNSRPGGTDIRLIVGPVQNAAAAAQLCARFAAAHVNCRTTKFDGERIAQR